MKSKKFIGQKRNRIFAIEKYEKENENEEKTEKVKRPKYSLIEISKLVLDYIKKEKNKTGNEITEHILKAFKPEKNEKIQKNIQRRVYDAINIMNAAGLIQKNKQQIKYIPLKEKNKNENNFKNAIKLNFNEINEEEVMKEKKALEEEYLQKLNQLNMLRQVLLEKYIKVQNYQNNININNKKEKNIKNNYPKKNCVKGNKIIKYEKENVRTTFEDNKTNNTKKTFKLRTEKIVPEFNKINALKKKTEKLNIFKIKNKNSKEENDNYLKCQKDKINIRNNIINSNINNNEDIVLNYLKKINLYKSG